MYDHYISMKTLLFTLLRNVIVPLAAPEGAWGTCAVVRRFIQRSGEIANCASYRGNEMSWPGCSVSGSNDQKVLGSFQDLMTSNGKRDFSEINHSYFD